MKNGFGILLILISIGFLHVTSALGSSSSFSDEPGSRREKDVNYNPDDTFLLKGNFQYFFQVLEKDGSRGVDEKNFQNQGGAFDVFHQLDFNDTFSKENSSGENFYIVLTKITYVMGKDVSFFAKHVLEPSFWQATQSKLGVVLDPKIPATDKSVDFQSQGSFWLPQCHINLALYDAQDLTKTSDLGIQKLLAMDAGLGAPALMLSEDDTGFQKKMGNKNGIESRTFSKYYPVENGKTLVVFYKLVYTYKLLPSLLGGVDGMRKSGLTGLQEIISVIQNYNQ